MGNNSHPLLANITTYLIGALAGSIGGCTAALMASLRSGKPRSVFIINFISYTINGVFVSLLGMALMMIMAPGFLTSFERILIFGLALGFIGSSALLGSHLVLRILLKSIGVEIVWSVKRAENIELEESKKADQTWNGKT